MSLLLFHLCVLVSRLYLALQCFSVYELTWITAASHLNFETVSTIICGNVMSIKVEEKLQCFNVVFLYYDFI